MAKKKQKQFYGYCITRSYGLRLEHSFHVSKSDNLQKVTKRLKKLEIFRDVTIKVQKLNSHGDWGESGDCDAEHNVFYFSAVPQHVISIRP